MVVKGEYSIKRVHYTKISFEYECDSKEEALEIISNGGDGSCEDYTHESIDFDYVDEANRIGVPYDINIEETI